LKFNQCHNSIIKHIRKGDFAMSFNREYVRPAQTARPQSAERVYSSYQQAIFTFIIEMIGNLFVKACAGAGKTSTIVECVNRLSLAIRRTTLFVAFSKEISLELERRLPQGVLCKTIHAMGWRVLSDFLYRAGRKSRTWGLIENKYRIILDYFFTQNKTSELVFEFAKDLAKKEGKPFDRAEAQRMFDELKMDTGKLLNMCQLTLTDQNDREALWQLGQHFDIVFYQEFWPTVQEALQFALEAGLNGLPEPDENGCYYGLADGYSFTDEVYLPVILSRRTNIEFPKYDMIFVDEAQDLSKCLLEFIMLLGNNNTRYCFVGDPNQSIMGFAGSNVNSCEEIIERLNCTVLPLSICYRCPVSGIELAKQIVPEIEAAPGAKQGILEVIKMEEMYAKVREGDMILCRANAPLVSTCFALIRRGVAARIRGRDIGKGLIRVIDEIEVSKGFDFERFPECADNYFKRKLKSWENRRPEEQEREAEKLNDKLSSVMAIYSAKMEIGQCSHIGDLRAAIENLFSDGRAAVTLCSGHRAKGLQEKNIFLLYPELFYNPKASDWEAQQLTNLEYVCLTRHTDALYIIEKEEKPGSLFG
jgi:superfamily I DNA/RNA helicase